MTAPLTIGMLEEAFRDLSTRPMRPTCYDFYCPRCKISGFAAHPLDACPNCGLEAK